MNRIVSPSIGFFIESCEELHIDPYQAGGIAWAYLEQGGSLRTMRRRDIWGSTEGPPKSRKLARTVVVGITHTRSTTSGRPSSCLPGSSQRAVGGPNAWVSAAIVACQSFGVANWR